MANELPVIEILAGIPGPAGGPAPGVVAGMRLVTDHVFTGVGSPEGVVTGIVGDEYVQTNGGGPTGLPVRWQKVVGTDQWGWLPFAGFPRGRHTRGAAADPGAATISTNRMAAWTLGPGTSNDDNAFASTVNFATAATLNDAKGPFGPAVARLDQGFDVLFHVKVVDTTLIRDWIGLFVTDPSSQDAPVGSGCGFRFSTGATDTAWQCHAADGAVGGRTNSGVAVAGGGWYLRMVGTATTIDYYVNGTHVAQRTTNLPAASALLSPYVRVTTLATAVKNLGFSVFDWQRNT